MADCPYCQRRLHWWQPLTTWRGEIIYCPHCLQALRIDKRRYAVLTGTSTAALAGAMLLPTEHPYLVIIVVGLLAIGACALFGKVVRVDSRDDE